MYRLIWHTSPPAVQSVLTEHQEVLSPHICNWIFHTTNLKTLVFVAAHYLQNITIVYDIYAGAHIVIVIYII